MQFVRHPSRRHPPLVFAQGGASFHEAADSVSSVELALMLGANGISTTGQRTADGAVVLSERTSTGGRFRRTAISSVHRADLEHLLAIDDLWALTPGAGVAVTVADQATAEAVVTSAAAAERIEDLWLCAADLEVLESMAHSGSGPQLVHLTTITALKAGPERHAADLARIGVHGVSMPGPEWTGGLTTLFHRFELDAVGRDVRVERVVTSLVRMGLDVVVGGDVETLVEAVSADGSA